MDMDVAKLSSSKHTQRYESNRADTNILRRNHWRTKILMNIVKRICLNNRSLLTKNTNGNKIKYKELQRTIPNYQIIFDNTSFINKNEIHELKILSTLDALKSLNLYYTGMMRKSTDLNCSKLNNNVVSDKSLIAKIYDLSMREFILNHTLCFMLSNRIMKAENYEESDDRDDVAIMSAEQRPVSKFDDVNEETCPHEMVTNRAEINLKTHSFHLKITKSTYRLIKKYSSTVLKTEEDDAGKYYYKLTNNEKVNRCKYTCNTKQMTPRNEDIMNEIMSQDNSFSNIELINEKTIPVYKMVSYHDDVLSKTFININTYHKTSNYSFYDSSLEIEHVNTLKNLDTHLENTFLLNLIDKENFLQESTTKHEIKTEPKQKRNSKKSLHLETLPEFPEIQVISTGSPDGEVKLTENATEKRSKISHDTVARKNGFIKTVKNKMVKLFKNPLKVTKDIKMRYAKERFNSTNCFHLRKKSL